MMTNETYGELELAPEQERTDFGHARIEIDEDVCDGCILCTVICPAGILEAVGKKKDKKSKVKTDRDNCMGCACCEAICLTGAIKVTRSYDFGGVWKQIGRGKLSEPRCF